MGNQNSGLPDATEAYIEKLHGWSHAIGVFLGIIGFWVLLTLPTADGPYTTPALVVYSISILFLFSASTLYHLAGVEPLKSRLRILDHIGIYLLIAGTYTPVCAITLWGSKGWLLLSLVWGIALAGTLLKLVFPNKYHGLALVLYLVMGWLIVLDFSNLILNTTAEGIWLLGAGGIFYTVGIVFYMVKRIPYNHLIWHGLVLLGAVSHWVFIATEVV